MAGLSKLYRELKIERGPGYSDEFFRWVQGSHLPQATEPVKETLRLIEKEHRSYFDAILAGNLGDPETANAESIAEMKAASEAYIEGQKIKVSAVNALLGAFDKFVQVFPEDGVSELALIGREGLFVSHEELYDRLEFHQDELDSSQAY